MTSDRLELPGKRSHKTICRRVVSRFFKTVTCKEPKASHASAKHHLFFLLDTLLDTGTIDSKLSYPSSNALL
jgi:hypothetical protein